MKTLIVQGDARRIPLPDGVAQCAVTSPPYFSLRKYGVRNETGIEGTPDEYISSLVRVFREVYRVLRDDGVLWVNIGDTVAGSGGTNRNDIAYGGKLGVTDFTGPTSNKMNKQSWLTRAGLKAKDFIGVPWLFAKAMQSPFYTGQIERERDRAWLAATIDGEGSICGFSHVRRDDARTRTGLNICITNASMLMLNEAERIWPASCSAHTKAGDGHLGKLDTYRWIVHGVENKIQLIRELYPYLVVKKRQAKVAYNLLLMMRHGKRNGQLPIKDEANAKRQRLTEMLSDLNRHRPVDLPGWLEEPPECTEPGWYWRSEVIWQKRSPMPESVKDRPTRSHEPVLMFTKRPIYFYDWYAVLEKSKQAGKSVKLGKKSFSRGQAVGAGIEPSGNGKAATYDVAEQRNLRSVWTLSSESFKGSHYAVMPSKLVVPCIRAGSSERGCCPSCRAPWKRIVEKHRVPTRTGVNSKVYAVPPLDPGSPYQSHAGDICGNRDPQRHVTTYKSVGWEPTCKCGIEETSPCLVIDPFSGAGTVPMTAENLGRVGIGVEAGGDYCRMAYERINNPHLDVPKASRVDKPTPLFDNLESA